MLLAESNLQYILFLFSYILPLPMIGRSNFDDFNLDVDSNGHPTSNTLLYQRVLLPLLVITKVSI